MNLIHLNKFTFFYIPLNTYHDHWQTALTSSYKHLPNMSWFGAKPSLNSVNSHIFKLFQKYNFLADTIRIHVEYIIGKNFIGNNFCRHYFFVGNNFRHLTKKIVTFYRRKNNADKKFYHIQNFASGMLNLIPWSNTRTRYEICSKLKIKTPEWRHLRRSAVFIVNFEHISHLVLVFLLLTLTMQMPSKLIHSNL